MRGFKPVRLSLNNYLRRWFLQLQREDKPKVKVRKQTKEDWLKEAVDHIRLQWYEQAISAYDQAVLLDPKDANTFYCRGFAYYKQQKYEHAIHDYSQAIALHP